jgi:peptide deformylase
VNVQAETPDGNPVEIEATGLSRALQHEVDHLNGIPSIAWFRCESEFAKPAETIAKRKAAGKGQRARAKSICNPP